MVVSDQWLVRAVKKGRIQAAGKGVHARAPRFGVKHLGQKSAAF